MADDKKPKIDLKSRLQKMGGTPAPPAVGSAPGLPTTGRGAAVPVPAPSGPGIPAPPLSGPAVAIDPTNPLAAVARPAISASFAPAAAGAAPAPQAQRIEVDEAAVEAARAGARKQWIVIASIASLLFMGLGYMAGGAQQKSEDRGKSVKDAHELAGDVAKAKESLDAIASKTMDGGKSLIGERKFPASLGQELSGLNVDFTGEKLFGRRFAGVPGEVVVKLMDFMTRVQALNNKKMLVVSLLNKLQKPITEEFSRPPGQLSIRFVVVVDKDTPGGGTRIASLVTPIAPDDKAGVPDKLLFANPLGAGNVELPRLKDPKIPEKGAAIPIVPTSFEKVVPSEKTGQVAQLVSTMNSLIDDINGEKADPQEIREPKPGLSELAQQLADGLNKVN